MNTKTLYSIKNQRGAHLLIGIRDTGTPPTIIADVQLIGALLPYSVPVADLQPFQMSEAMTEGDPITLLAQEAIRVYSLDAGRVQRAADLMRQPDAVQMAHRDEHDAQVKPSLAVIVVRGSKGWYVTRRNFCQCPDHAKGNTCKHRIAAWMLRETTARPMAQARRAQPAQKMPAEKTA